VRSSYTNTTSKGAPTELNTRPPGYKDLEDRILELENKLYALERLYADLSKPEPPTAA